MQECIPKPVMKPPATSEGTQWMPRSAILLICTSTYGRPGPLDAILQRKARIGEPSWIHHQPVEALVYGPIDVINRLAFNVAIENVEDVAMLPGVTLQHGVELRGRCGAVDRGLAPPEEGQVRAVHE